MSKQVELLQLTNRIFAKRNRNCGRKKTLKYREAALSQVTGPEDGP